ncbi:PGPGW domain-containing protein [Actinomadura flavalba]|uniref:PGPGW domain-containing protein n=1 Tax=Actinomadura flavalba TaxID=1120938 RepID=UPI000361FEAF|nr:PGPGW domain-containing protein [Actinomadura flavalba]
MAINQHDDLPPAGPPAKVDIRAGRFSRLSRIREVIRRNALLNTTWRIGVFTVGITVLTGGLIMMVTPGPGLLGIVVGLAILGTEFAWARRALHRAKAAADRAKEKALDPRKKRRNTILAVIGGILVGALVIAYLVVYDFRLPWNVADWTPWA